DSIYKGNNLMITVIDYGMGNIRSVVKAIELYCEDVQVSDNPDSLFESTGLLKVPHMGWDQVSLSGKSKFIKNIPDNNYFYFIHSYYPILEDKGWEIG